MLSTPSADSRVKRTCARRLFDEMPLEGLKVYHRRMNRRMPKSGIDALPDKVLARVLSFLPVQEAVQTCVLARRWCHLWRSMPVLHIVFEDGPLSDQDVENMNRFVNMFLFLRDRGAPLELCEFKMDDFEHEPHISLWIQQALLSQARSLNVKLPSERLGFRLDDMHLVSKHLTTLELEFAELREKFLDFSSCPVLKSLWMTGCNIRSDKISSQSLKKLTICGSWFEGISRTRISAPNLVWLELSDNTRTPFLENMPSLVKAFVRISNFMGNEEFCGDLSEDCILLKGLSMAESVELISPPDELLFKRDLLWCPIFSKLKTLLLNEWCVEIDFEALIWFLENTPVLEKLTLQLRPAPENWVEPRGFYIPSKEQFASSKLKVVEIKCNGFDERVHQVLRMLSIYNAYIEQVNIQWSGEQHSLCFSFQNNMDLEWC